MAFSELRTKGLRVCAMFDAAKLLILPPHGFYSAYLFHASPENCTVLITAHCKTDTITIDPFFQCHIICVFRPKVQQFSINRNNPTNCTATKRTMSHHSKNCATVGAYCIHPELRRLRNVATVVCGAAHAVAYRAYAIRHTNARHPIIQQIPPP